MSWAVKPPLAVLLSAVMLSAAESNPGEICRSAEYRQFDFVLGNWLLRDESARVVGTATFARKYGGCLLIETRLGVGSTGGSLGIIGFEQESKRWHRDFLDPGGVVLSFEGARSDAAMVMTGKDYPADGVRMHRVTWTPILDGSVEELWQTSIDGGHSWSIAFHARYFRIAE